MMFALPAAALAIVQEARPERRQAITGIMLSAALTSFLTGITEPIEFAFMFVAPVLYVFHAAMTGLSFMVMAALGSHSGFTFSGGAIDYFLLMPKSTLPWLVPVVGLAFAAVYYVTFRFVIRKFNIMTPGREELTEGAATEPVANAGAGGQNPELALGILQALGGPDNIQSLDACITRLRVSVNDKSLVNKSRLQQLGAAGVLEVGNSVQAVYGTRSDQIKEEIRQVIAQGRYVAAPVVVAAAPAVAAPVAAAAPVTDSPLPADFTLPVAGRVLPLSDVPDPVFSAGMMGAGFAIDPSDGVVRSPVTGEVVTLFPTHHAVGLRADNGLEVLVHFGIDTVKLGGAGFRALVGQGDRVQAGQPLLEVNLNEVRGKVPSVVTPVIFTDLDESYSVKLDGDKVQLVRG